MLTWYAAQTKPLHELIAEEALARKGFQAFNPKCYTQRVVRGRRTWTERCYIPGYIFVRFDPIENDRWPEINFTRGIATLLYSSHERPAPIRDKVMSIILERCNDDGVVKAEDIDVAIQRVVPVGSIVGVCDGPFEGFAGKVVWSDDERVKVVLSLFGRPTKVLVEKSFVALHA